MISDDGMNEFIQKVAASTSNSYPSYIDPQDVAQHLWVWYLDNEHTVTDLIRNNESWQPMLFSTMAKTAHAFMQQHEADVNGYSLDDVYHYSTAVVRTLLEDVFSYEDWQSFSRFGDGQPKSKRQNPTSDRIDMLIDVKGAVDQLTQGQAELIHWRYEFHLDWDIIADALGITENAARLREKRAVEAVRKKLGKKSLADMRNAWDAREGVYATNGERAPMSNAQALAYQESIY